MLSDVLASGLFGANFSENWHPTININHEDPVCRLRTMKLKISKSLGTNDCAVREKQRRSARMNIMKTTMK